MARDGLGSPRAVGWLFDPYSKVVNEEIGFPLVNGGSLVQYSSTGQVREGLLAALPAVFELRTSVGDGKLTWRCISLYQPALENK